MAVVVTDEDDNNNDDDDDGDEVPKRFQPTEQQAGPHTHQQNTETGATDTCDWSRVLLEFQ